MAVPPPPPSMLQEIDSCHPMNTENYNLLPRKPCLPSLDEEIKRLLMQYQLENPAILFHHPVQPVLQDGPQCGLVALSMASQYMGNSVTVEQLLKAARDCGFTRHGELFSLDYMQALSTKFLPHYQSEIVSSFQNNPNLLVQLLSQRNLILIPYDSDFNHAPCLKRGHKAHWALLIGLISSRQGPYVLARHGKSRHLACWPLQDLLRSNANLEEEGPHRQAGGYVVPEGGVGGERGLRCRALALKTTE